MSTNSGNVAPNEGSDVCEGRHLGESNMAILVNWTTERMDRLMWEEGTSDDTGVYVSFIYVPVSEAGGPHAAAAFPYS
jgi:hypothetical protein